MFDWVLNTLLVKTTEMTLQGIMGWKIESNWEDVFSSRNCFWYHEKSSRFLIIFKFNFFSLKHTHNSYVDFHQAIFWTEQQTWWEELLTAVKETFLFMLLMFWYIF